MRASILNSSVGLMACLVSLNAFAWSTVDDHLVGVSTMVMSMKTHQRTGKTFAAGFYKNSQDQWVWLIRESNNQGAKWKTVDEYSYPGSIRLSADSIAEDGQGTLYAQGIAYLGVSNYRWIVRASQDSGNHWATISDEPLSEDWSQFSLAADSKGVLYSAGSLGPFGNSDWYVRKSSDHGVTWQKVDRYKLAPGRNATVMGIAVDSQDRVFVTGYAQGSDRYSRWVVRRSIDNGTTWSTVDNYQMGARRTARGYNIAAGAPGLFVVGMARDTSNVTLWTVRKSTDGGTTWTTVDSSAIGNRGAFNVTADSGNVYVVGNSGSQWMTRVSNDGGATWANSDLFEYNPSTQSVPRAVCSSRGDVFVGGIGQTAYSPDPSENAHWLIRKGN